MKKLIWVVTLVVVIFVIVILTSSKNRYPTTNQPVKIGVAAALSGYAANWGEGETKAIKLAHDEYRDRLPVIEFVTENTKSDGLGTVNAIKKLIEIDHVQAIIGPTWGDSFQGGYSLATKAHVAIVSPSAAFEALEKDSRSPYMFSTWWPQPLEAQTLIQEMKKHGFHKVAILHDQDAFNTAFSLLFEQTAQASVPQWFTFNTVEIPVGTSDFRTHIAKLASSKPDAIFVIFQDTSSVGPFMKQLKEAGLHIQVYSTTSAENPDHLKNFPGLFDGLKYSFPAYGEDKNYELLHKKFITKHGTDASEGPAFVNAYNAASALFEVISQGARTGEEIVTALEKVQAPGIGVGTLSFDKMGQVQNVVFKIKEVRNNKFVDVQ